MKIIFSSDFLSHYSEVTIELNLIKSIDRTKGIIYFSQNVIELYYVKIHNNFVPERVTFYNDKYINSYNKYKTLEFNIIKSFNNNFPSYIMNTLNSHIMSGLETIFIANLKDIIKYLGKFRDKDIFADILYALCSVSKSDDQIKKLI